MSRITKEEIEKTKCGRFLLSDENIYLSIYSLNSYVFEYNLLNTEDRILYHRLQDKFDARLINGVITRVREQIIELFDFRYSLTTISRTISAIPQNTKIIL